jgi:hypothetical protein
MVTRTRRSVTLYVHFLSCCPGTSVCQCRCRSIENKLAKRANLLTKTQLVTVFETSEGQCWLKTHTTTPVPLVRTRTKDNNYEDLVIIQWIIKLAVTDENHNFVTKLSAVLLHPVESNPIPLSPILIQSPISHLPCRASLELPWRKP